MNVLKSKKRPAGLRLAFTAALALSSFQADAADSLFDFNPEAVTISAMPAFVSYPGGHQSGSATILPSISFQKKGEQPAFSAPDDAFDIPFQLTDQFSVGPIFDVRKGRSPDDASANRFGSSRLVPEVGAFAEVWISKEIRLRAEWRQGLTTFDRGTRFDFASDYVVKIDQRQWSIGPRLVAGDASHMTSQFGSPANKVSGGLESIGVAGSVTQPLTQSLSLTAFLRADRYIGAAANSPSVRDTNTHMALLSGLGLNYVFRLK